jgi:hypothetical protein
MKIGGSKIAGTCPGIFMSRSRQAFLGEADPVMTNFATMAKLKLEQTKNAGR